MEMFRFTFRLPSGGKLRHLVQARSKGEAWRMAREAAEALMARVVECEA